MVPYWRTLPEGVGGASPLCMFIPGFCLRSVFFSSFLAGGSEVKRQFSPRQQTNRKCLTSPADQTSKNLPILEDYRLKVDQFPGKWSVLSNQDVWAGLLPPESGGPQTELLAPL